MASQRNRIIELKDYLQSLGINVNIGKNKANGHKGVFKRRLNGFRIDVSKNLEYEDALSVLLHEFAHYVHYSYDSSLKSLDFIFDNFNDELREELINVTVDDVPKNFAKSLYEKKNSLSDEIKDIVSKIKEELPNFKQTLKYLLRYDRVRVFNKLYSVDNLDRDFSLTEVQKNYILLKSKQRYLRRINSKINKLNKYYNNPSELFARFIGMYYTNPNRVNILAPKACKIMRETKITLLKNVDQIIFG